MVSDKELEEGLVIDKEVSPSARVISQAEEKFGGQHFAAGRVRKR